MSSQNDLCSGWSISRLGSHPCLLINYHRNHDVKRRNWVVVQSLTASWPKDLLETHEELKCAQSLTISFKRIRAVTTPTTITCRGTKEVLLTPYGAKMNRKLPN